MIVRVLVCVCAECECASKQMQRAQKKESPPNSPETAHIRRHDIVKTTKYETASCMSQEGESVRNLEISTFIHQCQTEMCFKTTTKIPEPAKNSPVRMTSSSSGCDM